MRYFITLSYDGRAYHGWQIQPHATSVQERLNEALSTLLRTPIEVVGAGRTDAGVNASMMVAHFDYPQVRDTQIDGIKNEAQVPSANGGANPGANPSYNQQWCEQLVYKLNRFLPKDIAIHSIVPVRPEAHARFSATSRTYHYYVCTRKSPFHRHYAMPLHFPVDFDAMNRAARILIETEDFTSFSKLHTDVKTNICHVTEAHWQQVDATTWRFTITADRFLRNMVRAIVGTLLDVGRGRLTESGLREIISRKDRCAAGDSVMGEALFLSRITYPKDLYLE